MTGRIASHLLLDRPRNSCGGGGGGNGDGLGRKASVLLVVFSIVVVVVVVVAVIAVTGAMMDVARDWVSVLAMAVYVPVRGLSAGSGTRHLSLLQMAGFVFLGCLKCIVAELLQEHVEKRQRKRSPVIPSPDVLPCLPTPAMPYLL